MRKERPDEWKKWETKLQRKRREEEEDYLLCAMTILISLLSLCHMVGIWR